MIASGDTVVFDLRMAGSGQVVRGAGFESERPGHMAREDA